jgi:hypothetical protein
LRRTPGGFLRVNRSVISLAYILHCPVVQDAQECDTIIPVSVAFGFVRPAFPGAAIVENVERGRVIATMNWASGVIAVKYSPGRFGHLPDVDL